MEHTVFKRFLVTKKSQTNVKYFSCYISWILISLLLERDTTIGKQFLFVILDENATLLWTEPGNEILTYQLFHEGQETNVDDLTA